MPLHVLSKVAYFFLKKFYFLNLLHFTRHTGIYFLHVFNRPDVARDILQTPLSFINSLTHLLTHPFPPNLQDTFPPTPYELGTLMLRECSPPSICHMSCVTCHVSRVKCHLSHFDCHMSHLFLFFYIYFFLLLQTLWWT